MAGQDHTGRGDGGLYCEDLVVSLPSPNTLDSGSSVEEDTGLTNVVVMVVMVVVVVMVVMVMVVEL